MDQKTQLREIRKLGAELQAGNVLKNWDGIYTILRFGEHPGLDGYTARVAYLGDNWGTTVFDDDYYTVILPEP